MDLSYNPLSQIHYFLLRNELPHVRNSKTKYNNLEVSPIHLSTIIKSAQRNTDSPKIIKMLII